MPQRDEVLSFPLLDLELPLILFFELEGAQPGKPDLAAAL
jgi:hypothetical protein